MRHFILPALSLLCLAFPAHDASAAEEKKSANVAEYIKMDPLLLPIIDDDGVQQVVSMVVTIEVDGISNADKVKAMRPRLADAYIQNMYGILNKHAALKGGIIQVAMLKERLNKVTSDVVGHDMGAEVLIQVVQQRPI